jgi:LemA protein
VNREQIAALVLLGVLAFWIIGAYNRLVALRNVIGRAWAKVDEALRLRTAATEPLLAALREPLAAESGALDAMQATQAEAARTAAAVTSRPLRPAPAAAWVAAEAAHAAAASRVFALLDHDAELRRLEPVATHAALWRDAESRLAFSRQLFNDAAQTYDEAIQPFPTRLLLPLFGFGPAGRI